MKTTPCTMQLSSFCVWFYTHSLLLLPIVWKEQFVQRQTTPRQCSEVKIIQTNSRGHHRINSCFAQANHKWALLCMASGNKLCLFILPIQQIHKTMHTNGQDNNHSRNNIHMQANWSHAISSQKTIAVLNKQRLFEWRWKEHWECCDMNVCHNIYSNSSNI